MTIINSLIQKGTVGKIYIGIGGANVTQEYSQIYGFPVGVYVKNVASGTPAEKAGILQADIITAVDGKTVTTMDELVDTLQKYKAGDTVELTIYRADSKGGYNQTSVRVTVEQE
jgi:serine protease Do